MKTYARLLGASGICCALVIPAGSAYAQTRLQGWYLSKAGDVAYFVSQSNSNTISVHQYNRSGALAGYGVGRLVSSSNSQSQSNSPLTAILSNSSKDYRLSWNQCASGGYRGPAIKVRITNALGTLGATRYLVNVPGDSGSLYGLPAASTQASRSLLRPLQRYGQSPPLYCSQLQSSSVNQQPARARYDQVLTLRMKILLTDKNTFSANKSIEREFVQRIFVRRPESVSSIANFHLPDRHSLSVDEVTVLYDDSVVVDRNGNASLSVRARLFESSMFSALGGSEFGDGPIKEFNVNILRVAPGQTKTAAKKVPKNSKAYLGITYTLTNETRNVN